MADGSIGMKGGAALMLFLVALLCLQPVAAALPQTLSVQGRLTNATTGSSLTGTYSVNFSLYDAASAGNRLYSQVQSVSTDTNGIYSVVLTGVTNTFDIPYYLGVKVSSDSEMTPRLNLTTSPYAFQAGNVTCTGCLGTTQIADVFLQTAGDAMGGNLDLNSNLVLNIGSPNTDFTASGGLNLAGTLAIAGTGTHTVAGTTNFASNGLFVNSTNVGIGTAIPATRLDVIGSVSVSNNITTSNGVMISYDGTAYADNIQGIAIGESSIGSRNSIALGGTASTADDRFSVALGYGASTTGNNQFAIGSASYPMNTITWGSVGIGTTAPNVTLDIMSSGTTGGFRFQNTSGSTAFFINGTTGKVGIGTADPYAALEILSTQATQFQVNYGRGVNGPTGASFSIDSLGNLTIDAQQCTAGCSVRNIVLNGAWTKIDSSSGLMVDTNTLYVDATNNRVGIRTTSPTQPLEVWGNVSVKNTTTLSATPTANGCLLMPGGGKVCGNSTCLVLYSPGGSNFTVCD